MLYLAIKAALSGVIIAAASEAARRAPFEASASLCE